MQHANIQKRCPGPFYVWMRVGGFGVVEQQKPHTPSMANLLLYLYNSLILPKCSSNIMCMKDKLRSHTHTHTRSGISYQFGHAE